MLMILVSATRTRAWI